MRVYTKDEWDGMYTYVSMGYKFLVKNLTIKALTPALCLCILLQTISFSNQLTFLSLPSHFQNSGTGIQTQALAASASTSRHLIKIPFLSNLVHFYESRISHPKTPLLLLLAGSIVSDIGNFVQEFAQMRLIDELTHSRGMQGWDLIAGSVSVVVATPIALAVADHVSKRFYIGITILQMFQPLIILVLVRLHILQPWMIIMLSFFSGIAQAFGAPLFGRLWNRLLDPYDLHAKEFFTGFGQLKINIARYLGPVLGAFIFFMSNNFVYGLTVCLAANAVSFVVFAGLLFLIAEGFEQPTATHLSNDSTLRSATIRWTRSVSDGLKAWKQSRVVVLSFIMVLISTSLSYFFKAVIPDLSGSNGALQGSIKSYFYLGFAASSFIWILLSSRKLRLSAGIASRYSWIALAILGAGLLLLVKTPFSMVLMGASLIGAAHTWCRMFVTSSILSNIDKRYAGRVSSLLFLFQSFGFLLAGLVAIMADALKVSTFSALILAGGTALVTSQFLGGTFWRELRDPRSTRQRCAA